MSDPYQSGIIPANIYYKKEQVTGRFVVIMHAILKKRGLKVIHQPTRAVKKFEIIEVITTEEHPELGDIVNSITYLGFIEVEKGGVLKVGDLVNTSKNNIGKIIGFDETHMPNHMNIIIKVNKRMSGKDLNLDLGEKLGFTFQ